MSCTARIDETKEIKKLVTVNTDKRAKNTVK